jgi:hypothetical protein
MEEEDYYLKLIEKDNINISRKGFYLRGHNNTGVIYFVENHSVTPIEIEMPESDYLDVIVYGEIQLIERRYYIEKKESQVIPLEDRYRIQALLLKWLDKKSLRRDLHAGQ